MYYKSKENLLALGFPIFEDETEEPINKAFLALADMFGQLDGNGQRIYIPRLLEAFNAFCSGNDLMTYEHGGFQHNAEQGEGLKSDLQELRNLQYSETDKGN